MTAPPRLVTAEEFLLLPDPPEGGKTELVYGDVVRMAPVGLAHFQAAGKLTAALEGFAREHGLGPVGPELGVVLRRDPDLVRTPDVAFIAAARLQGDVQEGFFEGAPDLAVEVKSPDDTEPDILRKVAEYLEAGAGRVWVVRPRERTVTVHRMDRQDERGPGGTLSSDDAAFAAPGFELRIDDLFR